MLYLIFAYSLAVILLSIYLKKNFFLSNYTGDKHQLFSNQKNIPLSGGIFLLLPITLVNFNNIIFTLMLILIFSIGLFSDRKILISPKKRFLLQLILVLFSVILLDLQIANSKLVFFDNFLKNQIFNILFTSFCLLILINGSNFIDGLNGLLLFYTAFVIFVLLRLNLLNVGIINNEALVYLLFFLILIIILNSINILMLGDSGAYVISFFLGYLIITSHNLNPNISPYFYINLLWYPCFENLFSIIRKLKAKLSPLSPDSKHFHQLLYANLFKNFFKNKLMANNISSLVISTINFTLILIATINPFSSIHQIKLTMVSIFIYLLIYVLLKNKKLKNS